MTRSVRSRFLLIAAGVSTTVLFLVTAETQIYDSNFVSAWEGMAIVAGDHPYRDFYEWGAPLPAYLSAGMQLATGYRVIGEFLLQWSASVAGIIMAFHLGLRLCRSVPALAIMLPLVLLVLAMTATYHYAKLFVLPLTLWACWRYIERPAPRRSAAFGAVTAIAFLFRHDFGVYAGAAFLTALGCTRLAFPLTSSIRSVTLDAAAYAIAAGLLVAPWALAVHSSEGLAEYVRMRGLLFAAHQSGSFYSALLDLNPVATITAWLSASRDPRAATMQAALWLQQMTLLVPLLLLTSAGLTLHRAKYRCDAVSVDVWLMVSAGTFLVIVDSFLLRDAPYLVTVAPLSAALAARFAASSNLPARAAVGGLLVLSMVAAVMWTRDLPLYRPSELAGGWPRTVEQLLASPPVSAIGPLDGNRALSLRYLHDCTAPGDRVIVTGSTPFQVPYYVERPVAGGHLYWHHQWRSDPEHEGQLLELLSRQSAPFAFSTTDPILDDFKAYPRIREYLVTHYEELPGSKGRVLVDRRRTPLRAYGPGAFPCFAPPAGPQ